MRQIKEKKKFPQKIKSDFWHFVSFAKLLFQIKQDNFDVWMIYFKKLAKKLDLI